MSYIELHYQDESLAARIVRVFAWIWRFIPGALDEETMDPFFEPPFKIGQTVTIKRPKRFEP